MLKEMQITFYDDFTCLPLGEKDKKNWEITEARELSIVGPIENYTLDKKAMVLLDIKTMAFLRQK